jgi:P-type E1-E2 ATPase
VFILYSTTPTQVAAGAVLAVRAGEMILADGEVVKGEAVVDESALTGE